MAALQIMANDNASVTSAGGRVPLKGEYVYFLSFWLSPYFIIRLSLSLQLFLWRCGSVFTLAWLVSITIYISYVLAL